MKNILYSIHLLFLLFFAREAPAQQSIWKGWQYSWQVQHGLLAGSSDINFMVQTVQGVSKNNWFTGLGVGYDNYGITGIPVVLHGQRAFTQRRSKPFAYAQGGLQIPIKTGDWHSHGWDGSSSYSLHAGWIGEAGAGYLFGLGKNKKPALTISAGYSYKYNKADYTYLDWPIYLSSIPPANYDKFNTEVQTYHYRRIVVKIGFRF